LNDIEYSYLKQKLLRKIKFFSEDGTQRLPTLKDLTQYAHEVILEDLEDLIAHAVKPNTDYAVISGILVHAPNGQSYVSPGKMYVSVGGVHQPISVKEVEHREHREHHHHHHPSSSSTTTPPVEQI